MIGLEKALHSERTYLLPLGKSYSLIKLDCWREDFFVKDNGFKSHYLKRKRGGSEHEPVQIRFMFSFSSPPFQVVGFDIHIYKTARGIAPH